MPSLRKSDFRLPKSNRSPIMPSVYHGQNRLRQHSFKSARQSKNRYVKRPVGRVQEECRQGMTDLDWIVNFGRILLKKVTFVRFQHFGDKQLKNKMNLSTVFLKNLKLLGYKIYLVEIMSLTLPLPSLNYEVCKIGILRVIAWIYRKIQNRKFAHFIHAKDAITSYF